MAAWGLMAALGGVALFTELTPCPTAGLLGVPCPGCGLTRAFVALVSGEWREALRLQPLVPLVLACALGLWLRSLRKRPHLAWVRRGRRWLPERWVDLGVWASSSLCVVGLLAVWVMRFAGYWGGPVAVNAWPFIPR